MAIKWGQCELTHSIEDIIVKRKKRPGKVQRHEVRNTSAFVSVNRVRLIGNVSIYSGKLQHLN